MELTAAHWLYALVTVIIIVTMIFRRGVVLPALIGTLLVAWVYKGSLAGGFTAVFNANLVAAKELFNIFLIITFMVALLHSLKDLGADTKMIKPIQKVMVNGHVSFFVLVAATYVISLFFWPTPAVPLICALLVPAAVRAGLPVMGAAMAVAIAGQGMALASDYVMQVAPGLSATAAGIEKVQVADKAFILSIITGGIAIIYAYVVTRKNMRKAGDAAIEEDLKALEGMEPSEEVKKEAAVGRTETLASSATWSSLFAVLVPLSMLAIMVFMISTKITGKGGFEGGDGAAFIGGVAATLLVLATAAYRRSHALDKIADHVTDGFVFAFRAMGPVIPIAGFFFMGSSSFTPGILSLGEGAPVPAFLFDLVGAGQNFIPQSELLAAIGLLIIGIITGLDGSGFSGLPLTGALSGALAGGAGADPSALAAIGQVSTIFTGGGTIVAWSSLVAVAGFCGVNVLELARKNFLPVMLGLIVATIAAVVIW